MPASSSVPASTSGGQPLTRARLTRVLGDLPVHATYAPRNGPFAWVLEHALDRRRGFHPYNRWSGEEFAAARDADMEEAACRLAEAGYDVTIRPHPDPVELAQLPGPLRDQLAAEHPVQQPIVVPDRRPI